MLSWLTLLILSVLIHENARISDKEKNRFYLTYLLIAFSQLAEWTGIHLNGQADSMMTALKIAKCADYICTPMVGGALMAQMRIQNKWSRAIYAILAFNTVFQIISVFNGWVFYITADNCYEVGTFYPLYLAISLVIVIIVTFQFIIFGRNYRRQNQLSLYLILVLVLLSIAMQEILPGASRTLYIGITIAMALLFIHITEYSQMAADEYLTEQLVKINTDALTGLFSRHAYSQALKNYNAMGVLPEDFVVFSIDVNELKRTNDNLGHEAGDELIIGAADCIRRVVGDHGNCFRTGGDEFIVLAHADREEATGVIRRLQEETESWSGHRVKELHLAVGCALAADHPQLIAEKLVNKADTAMYVAKAAYYRSAGKRRDGFNYYDSLTGLPNTTYFFELAQRGQKSIFAEGRVPVVLFADISGMKDFNRKYGLSAGDEMLRSFSRMLNEYFGIDHSSRLGKDHFAVYTQEDQLEDRLNRLFDACKTMYDNYPIPVHVGIYRNDMGKVDISTAADRAKQACDAIGYTGESKFNYFN